MSRDKIKYHAFSASDKEIIYYTDCGDKSLKPIVLLHGLGSSGKEYSEIADRLVGDYRIVRFDYRGHGRSRKAKNFSQKRTAKDLRELMLYLDLRNAVFVGMSLGVHIILRYIEEYGQKDIKSLVFIDMSPKLTNNNDWQWGYGKGGYMEGMLTSDIEEIKESVKKFKQKMYLHLMNDAREDENKIENLNLLHKAAAALFFPQIIIDAWEDLFSQDYREILKDIKSPCAIIYGNPGSIYCKGTAEFMHSKIEKSEMFAYENVRHEDMLKETEKTSEIIKKYACMD